jgi:bifunctional UDP-N-acetylglucosamine pyrophosphorylase/glucosamine-1-phosphate N-acetyltransferase
MKPTAIILAAGKSTRIKSSLPKPLHCVCGKSMLEHVLQACYDAGCDKVVVVVGHGKEKIMQSFAGDSRIMWVEQKEQLGTGHAAKVCEAEIKKHGGNVFILSGDGPLIRGEVLKTLLQAHRDDRSDATLATAVIDNPFGYGRILRDEKGDFVSIVEEADATPEQKLIREVFPSYYCVKAPELLHALSLLKNNNKKGEYYLTDIFEILRKEGKKVVAVQAVAAEDILGVNTRQQLAEIDLIMQERIHRDIREKGVTIVNSFNTYIEAGVTVGPETVIHPFTFIGRDCVIGANCVVGPFARVPRSSVVPEGTTLSGNPSVADPQVGGD